MKKLIPVIIIILLGFLVYSSMSLSDEDKYYTFSCNPDDSADFHLYDAVDCNNPVSRYHIYDLGGEKVLKRINGTVNVVREGGQGVGSCFIYMANEIMPMHGDIDWSRINVAWNREIDFDKTVLPVPEDKSSLKVTGRYLILCGSPLTTTGLSEGKIWFNE